MYDIDLKCAPKVSHVEKWGFREVIGSQKHYAHPLMCLYLNIGGQPSSEEAGHGMT